VQDIRHAIGHAGAKVAASFAEYQDGATSHVLAAMVPDSLDYRRGARVTDREAFTGSPGREQPTASGAIQDGVAHNGVLVGSKAGHIGGHEHNLATAHTLAPVVLGFTLQPAQHPFRRERPDRRSG